MDLRQLEIFVTAYEKGSLSRAAECLNTSQPNVSKNIRALEEELGRPLLVRSGKGVQPTAVGRAVLEYAADEKKLGARTLFATHYHELCELEGTIPGVKNYNIVVKKRGDDIIFIKKIVRGGASDSYGIQVARLAGLPDGVIRRAKEILADIESRAPQALPKPATAEAPEEEPQMSLTSLAQAALADKLRAVEPDTLTPIEAMNLLYELKGKL